MSATVLNSIRPLKCKVEYQITGSPIGGCTRCNHNMYNMLKVGNFRMDFNSYELTHENIPA